MKKIAVIGATGFMGNSFFEFLRKNPINNVLGTFYKTKSTSDLHYLNMQSIESLDSFIRSYQPDFIIWAAGNKDLSRCENDFNFAKEFNSTPIINLIQILKNLNLRAKVLYISSDYVFCGKKGNYNDFDLPNPKTNYGFSKLIAEEALLNSPIDVKIVRTSAGMGRNSTFLKWVFRTLRESDQNISLFSNSIFTPTSVVFLAQMVQSIIDDFDHLEEKILHVVGDKSYSRFDFVYSLLSKVNPNYLNRLIPTLADLENSIFQKNLSMIQSPFIVRKQKLTNVEILSNELKCYL